MDGYIRLHRGITAWGWYKDANTCRVFIHLLLRASYKDREYMGIPLKAGQVVVGRKELAESLGISEQSVRTAIKHLKSTSEITIKSTNKFSVITIEKWEDYQADDDDTNQQINQDANQQLTSNQPATNHIQKGNKDKNININNNISAAYGEFGNVMLTDDEYRKLVERFPEDYQQRVENLSAYLKSSGRRYKSHYATILTWARKEEREHRETARTTSADEKRTGTDSGYYEWSASGYQAGS